MQKKFDNFQTPDDIALRFKIALSIGKAHIHFIGNQDYRTFDITGPAVDEVTVAQSVAKPGTVVVTRVAWEMCNQKLYTAEVMEHGFMLVCICTMNDSGSYMYSTLSLINPYVHYKYNVFTCYGCYCHSIIMCRYLMLRMAVHCQLVSSRN